MRPQAGSVSAMEAGECHLEHDRRFLEVVLGVIADGVVCEAERGLVLASSAPVERSGAGWYLRTVDTHQCLDLIGTLSDSRGVTPWVVRRAGELRRDRAALRLVARNGAAIAEPTDAPEAA